MNKTNTICVTILDTLLIVLVILYCLDIIPLYLMLFVARYIVKSLNAILPENNTGILGSLARIARFIYSIFTL